jgi:hypothetical protein
MTGPDTIRVKFKKSIIYDHVNWPVATVCEMAAAKATYLIGTNFVEATTEPCSERPRDKIVRPKDQAEATGKALAEALKTLLPPAPEYKPSTNRQTPADLAAMAAVKK